MLDKKALGDLIQEKRRAKGLRQSDVSDKIGVTRNYLSDIERGRYSPSVKTLMKLAAVLDLDLNSIKMTEIQYNEVEGENK